MNFAEAYHQSRVNAISDEDIDNLLSTTEMVWGRRECKKAIKWFKKQLLKQ